MQSLTHCTHLCRAHTFISTGTSGPRIRRCSWHRRSPSPLTGSTCHGENRSTTVADCGVFHWTGDGGPEMGKMKEDGGPEMGERHLRPSCCAAAAPLAARHWVAPLAAPGGEERQNRGEMGTDVVSRPVQKDGRGQQ
jgi:hypothetical protein